MKHDEIVYAVTMGDIFSALSKRLGEDEALKLTEDDLRLMREEVKNVLDHHLEIIDYLDIAIENWQIVRGL